MSISQVEPKIINPNLEAILAYQNEDIISRFLDKYNVTEEEAFDIFQETKKFLYLSHFKKIFITDDLLIVDEMWHNFILFTVDYHKFCEEYLGGYKHHSPTSKAEKEAHNRRFEEDPQAARKEFMLNLEGLMSGVYDHLGPQTLTKWFEEYTQKYTPQYLKEISL